MCATRIGGSDSIKQGFWHNFEDIPSNRIGYFVQVDQSQSFICPDEEAVQDSLRDFFRGAGLPAQQAVGKPVGSTTGMVLVALLPKLIGPSLAIGKVLLGWNADRRVQRRRDLFPRVRITILADHIDPLPMGPSKTIDSARTLAVILPELLSHLRKAFPALQFHIKIQARGAQINRVEMRVGWLPLTEAHVAKILKHLEKATPKVTIMQAAGWFGRPTIARADYIAPDLTRMGRL